MATISELNVRLGLLYKDFDKSLGQVEKRLERSGRKFSQLGNDLTLAVTAPLAALGAAAIQQAGEIESLKLATVSTFETAGRSAGDATKELEALRQAAKAPGLDFEQAVKGSIRLQGVGIAAEEARRILSEMANAIALTGGSAEDLDGVTKQFSQMIAKGRVLQEDVSIIAERMPKISGLMQQAFGTASVEAIRKSGVSAQEFVARITEAAAVLPRVEGGIKNALVNAGAEARNSLAKLGEAINKAFDIPKTLDGLTNKLQAAVMWFDSLDDSTKKTIIEIGLFAVALGPAIKVIGVMYGTIAQGIGTIRSFAGGLKTLAGSVVNAASAFQKFDLITKATVIGAVITSVVLLYTAYETLSQKLAIATAGYRALNEVSVQAGKAIAAEKVEADLLIKTIDSETASREEKAAALDKLKQISPQYFGQLKEENGLVVGLNAAYEKYIETLLRSAKVAAAREKLIENEKQLLEIVDQQEAAANKADKAFTAAAYTGSILSVIPAAVGLFQKTDESNLEDRRQALINQNKALAGFVEENDRAKVSVATATEKATAYANSLKAIKEASKADKADTIIKQITALKNIGFEETSKEIKSLRDQYRKATNDIGGDSENTAKKMADAYKKAIASIEAVSTKGDILDSEVLSEKAKEVENQMERLVELGFGPNSKPIQNLKKYLVDIRAEISKGFGTPNATQAKVGASPAAAPSIATLSTATSVQSIEVSGAEKAIAQTKAFADSLNLAKNAYNGLSDAIANSNGVVQIQAVFAEMRNGAITFGQAITESAKIFEEKYGQVAQSVLGKVSEIASGILEIQANRAAQEKAQLDEEYAAKLQAVEGNAAATKKVNEELAAKKAEIDKRIGKTQQKVAIVQAIINTALGVTQALSSAAPPVNFILAALTAAAGAVQIASIKSQKFAEGGVVTKPTLGLVGEYPGASTNPEIITPERKMRQVFREESAGGGYATQLYSIIKGEDLLLVSDKAARRRGRTS